MRTGMSGQATRKNAHVVSWGGFVRVCLFCANEGSGENAFVDSATVLDVDDGVTQVVHADGKFYTRVFTSFHPRGTFCVVGFVSKL